MKFTKNCNLCKKEFSKNKQYSYKRWNKAQYCSRKCLGASRHLGYVEKKCITCNNIFSITVADSKFGYGTYCSRKCQQKFSLGHVPWNKGNKMPERSGSNCHLWKGGITPIHEKIRKCPEYKAWRLDCMERDLFTCQECNQKGGYLEVDHIIPFSYIIRKNKITTLEEALVCRELWDMDNGRTLCKPCHKKTETWGEKAKKYSPKVGDLLL